MQGIDGKMGDDVALLHLIDDLPKTKDMVEKIMADTEEILNGLKAKYVVE